jgi:aromatic ring-opening dioxygenase catalytic subunit (LigB family)
LVTISYRSKDKKIMINSSPLAPLLYSHIVTSTQLPYTPLFTCSGSPAIASTLLDGFSDHSVTGIPSIPWTRGLDPPAWSTLIALFGEKTKAKVVQVSIPFGVKRWEMSEMVEVGKAMRGIRDEGVVIIGVGLAKKTKTEIVSLIEFPARNGTRMNLATDEMMNNDGKKIKKTNDYSRARII